MTSDLSLTKLYSFSCRLRSASMSRVIQGRIGDERNTFAKGRSFPTENFAECLFDKSCNVIEPVTSEASLVKEMAT